MTTTPYMIGKPFWQSRTIIGAVVVILAVALRHMGWEVDQGKLSDDISAGLELLGAILAFYGRIKADQPIVWTRGTVPGGAFNPEAEVRKAAPVQPILRLRLYRSARDAIPLHLCCRHSDFLCSDR